MLSPAVRPASHSADHVATDHELRRAYLAAKQLAEILEVCDLPDLRRRAVAIREQVFELRSELDARERG